MEKTMTVEYSQEELCDHIASGKSLVSWCHKSGVGYSTIMTHLREDAEFQKNYACAREAAADFHVDEVIEIADSEPDAARARVRVDARKWVAAKMKPKKYGDRTQQDIQHLDAEGKPTAPPSAIPAVVIEKLDAIADAEF